jgi:NADH-ubiquinone oxidoreductase chain 2
MLIFGLIVLIIAVALASDRISPILFTRITSIILLYSAALSLNALYIQSIGSGIGIYSGLFQITAISQSIDAFLYLIGALILIPWSSSRITPSLASIKTQITGPKIPEYSLIILFTTVGASFLVSSSDLVSLYLSIELQSFAVYILATIYRDSESSTSAGLKYFLLGGLSSCFILLGSGLIYSFTGLTSFEGIYSLLSVSEGNGLAQGLILGLIITVVGFLFKVAAAPFHNWAPDVYDGCPTIVTTWLTIMPKISIFILLLELVTGTDASFDSLSLHFGLGEDQTSFNVLKNLLLISSLLSLIIGTVVGLAQYRIKRLLAYSTISHVGFLLLALAINTEQSVESFLFYLIQYSITNLNTFFILLAFGYIINKNMSSSSNNVVDIQFISELKGQFFSNPLLSFSLAICLFSMAGIPPLIGFFAKQQVLSSALNSGYYFLSFLGIIVSVISASYYLKIIKVIHFEPASQVADGNTWGSTENVELTNSHSFIIASLTLTLLLFVIKPSILLNSTQLLALSLFYL